MDAGGGGVELTPLLLLPGRARRTTPHAIPKMAMTQLCKAGTTPSTPSTDAIVSGRNALRERVRTEGKGKPRRLGIFQTGARGSRVPWLCLGLVVMLFLTSIVLVILRPQLLFAIGTPADP
ncbi:hypothetical protein N9S81_00450, partial [bacterium]|nr:hypothetical protein [bacterium]